MEASDREGTQRCYTPSLTHARLSGCPSDLLNLCLDSRGAPEQVVSVWPPQGWAGELPSHRALPEWYGGCPGWPLFAPRKGARLAVAQVFPCVHREVPDSTSELRKIYSAWVNGCFRKAASRVPQTRVELVGVENIASAAFP